MTISSMHRGLALLLVALVFAACGDDPPAASAEDLAVARSEAADALGAVEELTGRLDELEAELSDSRKATKELSNDLDAALADLRDSLKGLKGRVGDAAAAAAAAAADIGSVARRIQVLEERYDFHLERYHGGG